MKLGEQPAHPFKPVDPWDDQSRMGYMGLSKREYFAGQIMAALASIPNTGKNEYRLAEHAVSAADALLAELAKPE